MNRVTVRWWIGVVTPVVVLGVLPTARASTDVAMEAVDTYDNTKGADVYPNIICVEEADDFRSTVLEKSGTAFTAGVRWINQDVWDTDFLDPDASKRPYDDDTIETDDTYAALGYFATHGSCNDGMTQPCSTSADCTTPNDLTPKAGPRIPT